MARKSKQILRVYVQSYIEEQIPYRRSENCGGQDRVVYSQQSIRQWLGKVNAMMRAAV